MIWVSKSSSQLLHVSVSCQYFVSKGFNSNLSPLAAPESPSSNAQKLCSITQAKIIHCLFRPICSCANIVLWLKLLSSLPGVYSGNIFIDSNQIPSQLSFC